MPAPQADGDPNLPVGPPQLNRTNLPRALDSQDLRVELPIFHAREDTSGHPPRAPWPSRLTHSIGRRPDFGCVGVLVDAKPEACTFYEKVGFVRLEALVGELGDRPVPVPMFVEIGQVP